MKLDDRIINPLEIYSPVNAMLAQVYIGQSGIFSNDSQGFENLKNANLRVLTSLELREGYTKRFCGDGFWYEYFLPLTNVEPKKEKVFRPYTLQEFKGNLPKMIFPDDLIHFRNKNNENNEFSEYAQRYNGYIVNSRATAICLGSREYTLGDLFKNFEYLDKDGEWNTFGVEE